MEHKKYEGMPSQFPDDDIACKDCMYRLPEIEASGGRVISKYKKIMCEKFKHSKPYDVLWNHAECPFYEEDVQGKAIDAFIKKYIDK